MESTLKSLWIHVNLMTRLCRGWGCPHLPLLLPQSDATVDQQLLPSSPQTAEQGLK